MKIKLFDILNSKDVLEKLGSTKFENGVIAWKLARNIKNINLELSIFEEVRRDLIIKYGEKKEGDIIEVLPSNIDKYTKEINEVVVQEVEIDILLLDPEKIVGFTPLELMVVEWMFQTIK